MDLKNKSALITGISGQDGSYLAENLLTAGCRVYGILRRNSVPENQNSRIKHIENDIKCFYGDLLDVPSLSRIVATVKPDLIFNLAAMSHVRISFDVPSFTIQTNALGVLNILEVYRTIVPQARFYQASSSEMFGRSVDEDGYQRETTPMKPTSPYGCAKVLAFNLVQHYRYAYGLFASNGILFNHSSPRRGSNFIISKVVKTAVQIKYGFTHQLELGNLDSFRDFGHSKDYTAAMIKILQHSEPDDFVIATGETHSVRDLCIYIFNKLGMDYQDYIIQNERYIRPEELKYLRGDASKARKALGWKPSYTFEQLLDEVIEYWTLIVTGDHQ